MAQQGKMTQLALPTGYQVEKVRTLKQTIQDIQHKFEKIKLDFQKVLEDPNTESWLVPPEDVSYSNQPRYTSTQNNAITTEGIFRGATVAVKRLNLEKSKPEDNDAILKEIHIMTQIRHPNIVQFIAATYNAQVGHIIITELLEIPFKSPCDTEQVRSILRDLAKALDYLHRQKEPIIHRDVKPENLYLISRVIDQLTWTAKLSGFGSAIFAKDANTLPSKADEEETEYTAPEPNQSTSTKSDVYSFGVIMKNYPDHKIRRFRGWGEVTYSRDNYDYDYEHETYRSDFLHRRFYDNSRLRRTWSWDDIANSCATCDPRERPTMSQVLEQLKSLV